MTARKHLDAIALKAEGGRGRAYSYGDLLENVRRLAAGLQAKAYASCDEIALLSENRPEWAITYLAVVAAGKTVIPIDANLKPGEIAGIIRHAGVKVVFCSRRLEATLAELTSDVEIVSLESDHPRSWEHLMTDPQALNPASDPDATATLIYTSGTTGDPKAVILTHRNLLSNLTSIRTDLQFSARDSFLSVLPLHHTFEATCGFLTPLTTGCSIVYARSLKSRDIQEDLSHNKATVMCGVPLLYEKLYDSIQRGLHSASGVRRFTFRLFFLLSALGWRIGIKAGRLFFASLRKRAGLNHLRMFVSGGAALAPHICKFFNLLGLNVLQGYGLTECSPVVSANRPGDITFDSVGPPLSGIEVRIHNPSENGIGEITVRGTNVTPGYKDNPEKTAELVREGWLYTGDLGCLANGRLYITGRAKNLIVSAAGKNIYPEELEEKLTMSSYISEVLVFGRKRDGKQGEEVRALIVPDSEGFEAELSLQAVAGNRDRVSEELGKVVAAVNRQVADYKRITGFDLQFEELEKTSSKKVKRYLYNSMG